MPRLSRLKFSASAGPRIGYGCSLSGAFNVAGQVLDAITVMHGDAGCAHLNVATHFSTDLRSNALSGGVSDLVVASRLVSTALREQDVVFGGEDKLRAAILEVDRRYQPALILVITACVAEIIGDDLPAILAEVRPRVRAPVLLLPSGGVCSGSFATGMVAAHQTLIEQLVRPVQPREERTVNILAEKNLYVGEEREFREVERLLGATGVRIRARLVRRATVEAIRGAGGAAFNVLRAREYGLDLARLLQEMCGTPYLDQEYPAGRQATAAWLAAVGEALGLTEAARQVVISEETAYWRSLKALRSDLEGKRLVVNLGIADPSWLLELAADAGLRVLKVNFLGRPGADVLAGAEARGVPLAVEVSPTEALAETADLQPELALFPYGQARPLPRSAVRGLPSLPPTGYRTLEELAIWARLARRPAAEGWRHAPGDQ
ncbi:MAG: nitrogenase component 1 [Chloroflexi bacterium]|nr:nitrogenase component 1 [Chloroflexota bacterium]